MRIRFTRLTNDRHALEIVRANGSRERVELETRSFFLHDLTHYALESTAKLEIGVFGNLASGKSMADLNDRTGEAMGMQAGELMHIERVTGPLYPVVQGRATVEDAFTALTALYAAEEQPLPDWLTLDCLSRTAACMRKLLGQWRATPFGQTMELGWP